jgi:RNA polymerase sigma-70 factor (ECF subfamily)
MIYNEQMEELRSAIGRLKDEQRTALVLYTFENFSYQDIADVMQCTLSKVESLIFRAKKNLAKEIRQ